MKSIRGKFNRFGNSMRNFTDDIEVSLVSDAGDCVRKTGASGRAFRDICDALIEGVDPGGGSLVDINLFVDAFTQDTTDPNSLSREFRKGSRFGPA